MSDIERRLTRGVAPELDAGPPGRGARPRALGRRPGRCCLWLHGLAGGGAAGGGDRSWPGAGGVCQRASDEVLEELAARVSPRVLRLPGRTDAARRELDEYFAGERHRFDLPLDWSLVRGFAQGVLRATARVPFGSVTTYRQMAEAAGSPRASRAAGNALGSNPIPIVVPCHRVLHRAADLAATPVAWTASATCCRWRARSRGFHDLLRDTRPVRRLGTQAHSLRPGHTRRRHATELGTTSPHPPPHDLDVLDLITPIAQVIEPRPDDPPPAPCTSEADRLGVVLVTFSPMPRRPSTCPSGPARSRRTRCLAVDVIRRRQPMLASAEQRPVNARQGAGGQDGCPAVATAVPR